MKNRYTEAVTDMNQPLSEFFSDCSYYLQKYVKEAVEIWHILRVDTVGDLYRWAGQRGGYALAWDDKDGRKYVHVNRGVGYACHLADLIREIEVTKQP